MYTVNAKLAIASISLVLQMRDVGFDGIPDKFGYFYGRNDTTWSDGVINMHTGVDSVSNMSVVARFNNSDRFPGYPGECGRVRGTGDTVPPGQKKTRVDIFAADMCRPISMEYDGETVKDDITMYQFRYTMAFFGRKKCSFHFISTLFSYCCRLKIFFLELFVIAAIPLML